MHDSILHSTLKVNHPAGIVVPELFPAVQLGIVNIETLSLIADIAHAGPVFLDDAVPQDKLNLAATGGIGTVCGDHIPLSDPEIELPIQWIVRHGFAL